MKLVLMAAAAAALFTAPPALAQYNSRSVLSRDLAAIPATDRSQSLSEREDWLQSKILRDADRDYIARSDADLAIDRLKVIRDQQARLEQDDGSLAIADASLIQSRIDRLENRVRNQDSESRYW